MFWVPMTFRDWMWMFYKMLTDPPPDTVVTVNRDPVPRCPHCGK